MLMSPFLPVSEFMGFCEVLSTHMDELAEIVRQDFEVAVVLMPSAFLYFAFLPFLLGVSIGMWVFSSVDEMTTTMLMLFMISANSFALSMINTSRRIKREKMTDILLRKLEEI